METQKDILISIIIPTYNQAATLNRCIDSVLASSYKKIEIIIVDDGSTDESWKIIQSYRDYRIKSVHVANGGVTVARNIGLNMATGDYVHFVDSDDFIELDIYEVCSDVMSKYLPDVILFDFSVYFELQQSKYGRNFEMFPQGLFLIKSM